MHLYFFEYYICTGISNSVNFLKFQTIWGPSNLIIFGIKHDIAT